MAIRSFSDSGAEDICHRRNSKQARNCLPVELHHKAEVNEYLRERKEYAAEVWAKIEARQGSQAGLREKLLARLENKK